MKATRMAALGVATLAALGLAAALPQAAHAQNLVQDGDFESAALGDPSDFTSDYSVGDSFDTSWTITGGTVGIDTDNGFVLDGHKSLFLDDTSGNSPVGFGSVQQFLDTTPGQTYVISFYAGADTANSLFVSFDGSLLSGTDPILVPQNGFASSYDPATNAGLFTHYTYTAIASSSSTELDLSAIGSAFSNGVTVEIDNISVTPAPEPSSVAGMGLGILGMAGLIFSARRRKALSA